MANLDHHILIPEEHLRVWLLFVRACTLLFSRIVSESEVRSADQFLVVFCKKFEELYGQKHCTPNMHLHLHLLDSFLDYGPAHGFWCFPFERFNGRLGDDKAIESQIMNKLCHEQAISRLNLGKELGQDFHSLYQKISTKVKGSLKQTVKVEN